MLRRAGPPAADPGGMSTSSPVRAPQPPPPDPQRPTRPVAPGHLEWLRTEVEDWQREGLIDPGQAQTLVGRYHATRTLGLASLLLALGAVFVGFGLIWLVAANLDRLTPLTRFTVVAAIWVAVTVGAELLAVRRAHGGPVPSPVVHAGRLLAALLFGAVVFQAAQSLQVPAYEPRLVGRLGARRAPARLPRAGRRAGRARRGGRVRLAGVECRPGRADGARRPARRLCRRGRRDRRRRAARPVRGRVPLEPPTWPRRGAWPVLSSCSVRSSRPRSPSSRATPRCGRHG